MSGQTTYEETPAIGFSGMLAEPFSLNQIDSGLVGDAAGIGLGVAVRGDGDGIYVPCAADEGAHGVAVFAHTPQENQSGEFKYEDKTQFPILNAGRYWAVANTSMLQGTVVGFDPATGKVGPVVGATTTLEIGKTVSKSGADGDLVIVEIYF